MKRKWYNVEMDDYGGTTSPMYKEFEKDYRKFLRKICKKIGANLHKFNPNHYEFSAILEKDGKYIYFSISDTRYFKNEWCNHILIRTMAHDHDWRGGTNNYTDLDHLEIDLINLFQTEHRPCW